MSKKKINYSKNSDPKNIALNLKEEGNKYYQEENYEKAIKLFTQALEIDENAIFYSNRSACYLSIADYENAISDANKSIYLDPSFVRGYYRAANSYFLMGDLEKAIEIIKKCDKSNIEADMIKLREKIENKINMNKILTEKYESYPKFIRFFNWLDFNKVYFPKLELKYITNDHRGIVSKYKIKKDEIILKIPYDMLITLEMAKESPLGNKMLNSNLDLLSPKHCYLSVFLLQEKIKENSKWKLYLDILPEKYDNFPIFYTENELNELKGSPFLILISEKQKDIAADFNMILQAVPEFGKFSLKEFTEMRMAVSSRIFGIKVKGVKTDCFAPLADMLNHKRPRQTQWYFSDEIGSFVIQSLQNIDPDEQIYDSYGKKCNSRFLLNYGFIVEQNDSNEYSVSIEFNETHPNYKIKINFMQNKTNTKRTFRIVENFNSQVMLDFFSFLRFVNYDEEIKNLINAILIKKENIDEDDKPTFYQIPPMSIKSELKVLSEVEKIMYNCLEKYSNDYDYDMNLLKKIDSGEVNVTNNIKNCIQMRLGEKKILNFFLNFSQYVSSLFYMKPKDIKKKVKKDFPNICPYEEYINDVILYLIRKESSIQ